MIFGTCARQLPNAGVYATDGQPLVTATLGVVANGRIVGGALFFNWRGHDIEVAAAFEGRPWARPATLRTLFAYPFVQLGCVRATALTARGNRRARRVLRAHRLPARGREAARLRRPRGRDLVRAAARRLQMAEGIG